MGKVEKVVVLGVLFSVLVILAVSMYSSPDDEVLVEADPAARRGELAAATRLDRPQRGSSQESSTRAVEADRGVQPGPDQGVGAASPQPAAAANQGSSRWQRRSQPSPLTNAGSEGSTLPVAELPGRDRADSVMAAQAGGLLNSSVRSRQSRQDRSAAQPQQEPAATTKRSAPDPAWDLITVEGLAPTLDPRFQIYTCQGGETFITLAQALYGTEKKAALLRRDNEGVESLSAGQELLVAVVDDRPGGGDRYEVLEGENLWNIAKKVYGAGSRWQEIYDANGDVLRTPDDIRPGVVLVIP